MSAGLPHNWESERSVLGGLMLSPDRLSDVRAVVTAEQFHRPAHQTLFALIVEMSDAGLTPDTMVILDAIEARGIAEKAGGVSYVIALPQACMFVDNLVSYARTVADHAVRRDIVLAAREIEAKVMEGQMDGRASVAFSEAAIHKVAGQLPTVKGGGWVSQSQVLQERLEDIRLRTTRPDSIPGTSTGIAGLDRLLGGWQRGRFYVVAGRPAMGKSAVAQWTAEHGSMYGDVGILTLEMPKEEVGERALIQEGRVNSQRVRDGSITESDWRDLCDAEGRLSERHVWIDDASQATIVQIVSKVRTLKAKCPELHTVYLDYLQLATAETRKNGNRQQEVGAITRGLKSLAKDLNIAVVAIAQLSRQCEARTDKRPMPSDLRESGDIEQDADAILFVYRDDAYVKDSPKKGIMEIIVAKNRGGATGTVEVAWIGAEYRIAPLDVRPGPDQPPPPADRWSGYQ